MNGAMEAFLRRYGLFVLFTAIGLLFFSYHYLDDLARQHYGTAPARFIEEMTGAYAGFVLLPLVVFVTRRFPWTRAAWPAALVAQAAGLTFYSVAHTTLMAVSRAALFPLAGLGTYDYGVMAYRYPMEASHDAITYAVMVVAITFIDRFNRARAAELAAVKLEAELAQTKLENLRLQLHPHFLFNTLNAISAVMYEDVRRADAMLVRLSDFLRVILTSSDSPEILLEEELQIERMYFNVMQARLESKLRLSLDIEAAAENALVPSLLLQPLIENAIQHGMGAVREELEIDIVARRSNGHVEIRVRDNGIGPGANQRDGAGRGIANVKSRLGHLYGDRFAFAMERNGAGGTDVNLRFPYRSA